MELTYGTFVAYLKQINPVRLFEAGEDPFEDPAERARRTMSPEELAKAVLEGHVDGAALMQPRKRKARKLTAGQKKIEEKKLKEDLGLVSQTVLSRL